MTNRGNGVGWAALVSLALVSCGAPAAMGDAATSSCTDSDGDGHGAVACGGDDCDDTLPATHPGATETCNGVDDDCNGSVDDGPGLVAEAVHHVIANVRAPTFLSLSDAADGFVAVYGSGSEVRGARVDQIDIVTTSQLLSASTIADSTRALVSTTAAVGCPDVSAFSLDPAPCDASGACGGTETCVTAPDGSRICEHPVLHNTPQNPGECQTHAECQDGLACNGSELCEPRAAPTLIDARGCHLPTAMTPCAGASVTCDEAHHTCVMGLAIPCQFAEMDAAGADATELMTIAVTTDRCFDGRVRPGLATTANIPWSNIYWGDDRVTTSWLGVDLADDECTGASRPPSEARGASGVSIAALGANHALGRDAPEALAAWRAAPSTATGPVPVEVIGLWREQYGAGADVLPFVDASDDDVPVRLPASTTSARIGIASYSARTGAGYVVAYADATGGVSFSVLRALGNVAGHCPADPCLVLGPGADNLLGTADDDAPTTSIQPTATRRTTPALGAPTSSTLDATVTPVGDVSVATGAEHGGNIDVAFAYATSGEIVVAQATIAGATGTVADGARVHLAAAGTSDVRIVHVEAGVSVAGQFGSQTIAASEVGGFVITWTSVAGTFAARLSDHTHALVAPGVVRLGAPSDSPMAFVDYDTAMSHPRLRVAAHQADAAVVFTSVCGPGM